jgi:hypothetical protein
LYCCVDLILICNFLLILFFSKIAFEFAYIYARTRHVLASLFIYLVACIESFSLPLDHQRDEQVDQPFTSCEQRCIALVGHAQPQAQPSERSCLSRGSVRVQHTQPSE